MRFLRKITMNTDERTAQTDRHGPVGGGVRRRDWKGCAAAMTVLGVAGCAAVTTGTTQNIFVDTPKDVAATCTLTDSKTGKWYLPSTPGGVSVLKGDGPMNVVCEKEGYETAVVSVDEDLVAATFGNILLGGGIGFIIDAASGAAQKYPDRITVWMKPKEWASDADRVAWEEAKRAFDDQKAKEEAAKKAAHE